MIMASSLPGIVRRHVMRSNGFATIRDFTRACVPDLNGVCACVCVCVCMCVQSFWPCVQYLILYQWHVSKAWILASVMFFEERRGF